MHPNMLALHRQRGLVRDAQLNLLKCPFLRIIRGNSGIEQARFCAWVNRDAELVERVRKAIAAAFDVRFFARPAAKERVVPHFRWKLVERGMLGGRKNVARHALPVQFRIGMFDVDAKLATGCNGIQRNRTRMRNAERKWHCAV